MLPNKGIFMWMIIVLVSLINLPGMFEGNWYSWLSFAICNVLAYFTYENENS